MKRANKKFIVWTIGIIALVILLYGVIKINSSPPLSPSSTQNQITSPTESQAPTEDNDFCCMLKDGCVDMKNEDYSKCRLDNDYINHDWYNKCSEIYNCRMGCCFEYNLEENNAGTCSQTIGLYCTLASLGSGEQQNFYPNTSCEGIARCDDRYGCCIWVEGDILLSTVLEENDCLYRDDSIFLKGQRCPAHICLDDSYCPNDGRPFCSVIRDLELYDQTTSVPSPTPRSTSSPLRYKYKYHCDIAIRTCQLTLLGTC